MKITSMFLMIIALFITTTNLCSENEEFKQLEKDFERFTKYTNKPTTTNTITAVAGIDKNKQQEIVEFAKNSYPILDDKTEQLCTNFLAFKKIHGSHIEKNLYQDMPLSDFLIRLLEKRPLAFAGPDDKTILRDSHETEKPMDFTKIGTDQEQSPLIMKNPAASCGVSLRKKLN